MIQRLPHNEVVNSDIQKIYSEVFKKSINIEKYRKWYQYCPLEISEYGVYNGDNLVCYKYIAERKYKDGVSFMSGGSQAIIGHGAEFVFLLKEILRIVTNKDGFIYGFCNENSHRLFTSKLFKWDENKNYKQIIVKHPKIGQQIERKYYDKIDAQNIFVEGDQLAFLNRDIEWLRWRLKKPDTEYVVYRLNNVFVISKRFGNSIDIMCLLNSDHIEDYYYYLNMFISQMILDDGVDGVFLICTQGKLLSLIDSDYHYESDGYQRFMCTNNMKTLYNENLLVELIDSDVY
jgi:hypothetical protein